MNTYYWTTDEYHSDNSITMLDYLNNHMDEEYEILIVDTTYAEIVDQEGNKYAVRSSGNGDSFNHKIEFERL